ncbi:related to alcohol oxidase [Cephalotrichum gorgonifer]|uniref:Related to alcohol oxidase n=1 Tax=Cephalotrichum gorgonifer TaxID=2041049 RepID=A0AAE8SS13_9PEZI|nr:related to alcohol oxidase [Cephalotrichum gorgonifer]
MKTGDLIPLAAAYLAAVAAAASEYDYVIVGGGTAGIALATRLSLGLPDADILVIEAGPAALDEIRINAPGMRGSTLGSVYDWNYTTTPQESINGRVIDVNRGHVLGGSSALNYLCYDRASAAEYNGWGELGNKGWNWDTMSAAMVKSENFTGTSSDLHGDSGPIRSTFNRNVPECLASWLPTMNALGIDTNEEFMGGFPIGASIQTTNIDVTHYTRSYSAVSYLPLAGSNLEVMTETRVAKVNIVNLKKAGCKKLHATGVTLEDGTVIKARKEVVLTSGSIGSPGLLELSGVGQAKVLKAAGIKQLIDLPGVGENLQDHIRTSNSYTLKPGFESFDFMIYDNAGPAAAAEVARWLAGEPSWVDYTSATYGFLNLEQIAGKEGAKSLIADAKAAYGKTSTKVDLKKIEQLSDATVPQVEIIFEANYIGAKGYPGSGNLITLFSSLAHPMSRGSVHIDATNPLGKPIINPNYLSNDYDLQASIAAAKYARKIANTEPMASTWENEWEPGPEVETDEQWEEFVRGATQTFYHPVGTCAMLPRKDGGVVDSDLVVYGTANLRVVDSSITPTLLSAHIQTAVYGIAEIAAEKIIAKAKSA